MDATPTMYDPDLVEVWENIMRGTDEVERCAHRKRRHNETERRRVTRVNAMFARLRAAVGVGDECSKGAVLEMACEALEKKTTKATTPSVEGKPVVVVVASRA